MGSKKVLGRGLGAFFPEQEDEDKQSPNSGQSSDNKYVSAQQKVNVL